MTSCLGQLLWHSYFLCEFLVVVLARNFSQLLPLVWHVNLLSTPHIHSAFSMGEGLGSLGAIVCKRLSSTPALARDRSSWRWAPAAGDTLAPLPLASLLTSLSHPSSYPQSPRSPGASGGPVCPGISSLGCHQRVRGHPCQRSHATCQLGEQASPWCDNHLGVFPSLSWGLGSLELVSSWVLATFRVPAAARALVPKGMAHSIFFS